MPRFLDRLPKTVGQEINVAHGIDFLNSLHIFLLEGVGPESHVGAAPSQVDLAATKDLAERQLIVLARVLELDFGGSGLQDVARLSLLKALFVCGHAILLAFKAATRLVNKPMSARVDHAHRLPRQESTSRHLLLKVRNTKHGASFHCLYVSVVSQQLGLLLLSQEFLADGLLLAGD